MSLRPRHLVLLVLALVALALPAYASGAKLATFYQYGSHCKKRSCTQSSYTNSANTQLLSFYVTAKCKGKNQTISISLLNGAKIKKKKFKVTQTIYSYPVGSYDGTIGTLTLKGTAKKRKKIYGTWKIDKVAEGCEKAAKGKFSLKYKGSVSGGG